jgi:arginyl-tRNA synthetase
LHWSFRHGGTHAQSRDAVIDFLSAPSEDDETRLDALIALAQEHLGEAGFTIFFDAAIDSILEDIRNDLDDFGVHYDRWYS